MAEDSKKSITGGQVKYKITPTKTLSNKNESSLSNNSFTITYDPKLKTFVKSECLNNAKEETPRKAKESLPAGRRSDLSRDASITPNKTTEESTSTMTKGSPRPKAKDDASTDETDGKSDVRDVPPNLEDRSFKDEIRRNRKKNINESRRSCSLSQDKDSSLLGETIDLSSPSNVDEFEAIDMLHDLDGLIEVTDTDISPSVFNNITQIENESGGEQKSIDEQSQNENRDYCKEPDVKKEDNCMKKRKRTEKSNPRVKMSRNTKSESDDDSLSEDVSGDAKNIVKALALAQKKEVFSKEIRDRLRNFRVHMEHEVPPLHKDKILSRFRRMSVETRNAIIKKYGPVKYGPFTREEDRKIIKNWKTFCAVHDWDRKFAKPFLSTRDSNGKFFIPSMEERHKFVQFLGNGLPLRLSYSIYNRFRTLYSTHKRFRYTKKEDSMIMAYMQSESIYNPRRCEISKVLRRRSQSILERYQRLMKRRDVQSIRDIVWTLPRVEEFINQLMELTLSTDVRELKYAKIPKVVWIKMEEKLDVDQKSLKFFWLTRLHMQLFYEQPLFLNNIKVKLIKYFYKNKTPNTQQISWPDVSQHFDGMTSLFLCLLFHQIIDHYSYNSVTVKFPDLIKYLYTTKVPLLMSSKKDKYLPHISYENGKATIVDTIDE